jgi:hypothetical protein
VHGKVLFEGVGQTLIRRTVFILPGKLRAAGEAARFKCRFLVAPTNLPEYQGKKVVFRVNTGIHVANNITGARPIRNLNGIKVSCNHTF